ncbi:MAG TPA: type II secretion system protein [Phycisphaerales bacterium]|nr:type II secretion system protein [Phycisphaerales bacterium]
MIWWAVGATAPEKRMKNGSFIPARHVDPRRSGPARRRAGFTLVELLVTVAVIGVLIGILLVALSKAYRSAKASSTTRLFQTVGSALEAFKNDLGYYPPLLYDPDQPASVAPNALITSDGYMPNFRVPEAYVGSGTGAPVTLDQLVADTATNPQPFRYGSEYSLVVYLMGIGDLDASDDKDGTPPPPTPGIKDNRDDGADGPGIRNPGSDHSWGFAKDRTNQAAKMQKSPTGRVYGPYLDIASLKSAARLDPQTGLYKLVDTWNNPIRYYKGWATRDRTDPTKLSAKRVPVELRTREALEAQILAGGEPDLTLETDVMRAPYMLLSAGSKPTMNCNGVDLPQFGDRQVTDCTRQTQEGLQEGFLTGLSEIETEYLKTNLEGNVRYSP